PGNADGCSSPCRIETGYSCSGIPSLCTTVCGDGVIVGREQCDDRNRLNGDGCTATCTVERGYVCNGTPSLCIPVCGDGVRVGNEGCDDGNLIDGDGCSSTCIIEPAPLCGNGRLEPGEQCESGIPCPVCSTQSCPNVCDRTTCTCSYGSSSSSSCSLQACQSGYMCVPDHIDCRPGFTQSCSGSCGTASFGQSCTKGRCCTCISTGSSSSSSSSGTPMSDLSVTMSAPSTVSAGRNIAYSVLMQNAGPSNENSASILTRIPDGLVFSPQNSDAICAQQGANILCSGLAVMSGQSRGVTLAFSVSTNSPCNEIFQNSAIVMGKNSDRNFSNNFSPWVSTTVQCMSPSGI
ncbi:MAG: DUF4215 domain-containing protein, partial [Candidatus Peribacteraceae bacterium]|nr:DUF4215 domain-containing protein [Candidatus Peribacteraceae bacterium]